MIVRVDEIKESKPEEGTANPVGEAEKPVGETEKPVEEIETNGDGTDTDSEEKSSAPVASE